MKKLQKKMIAVVFVSVIIVLSVLALGYYFTTLLYNTNQADAITKLISINNGSMPKMHEFNEQEFEEETKYRISLNAEAEFRTRYFIVNIKEKNNEDKVETDHIAAVSEDEARDMADQVMLRNKETGYINVYRYRLVPEAEDKNSTDYIIFLDCREYMESQRALFKIAIFLSIVFSVLVAFIFASLSSKILEPFEKNQKAQKQFITDASHELKTPLAIISANAEVLKYKSGDNEWVNNIVSQTERMGKLINQLLILSRMEEVGDNDKKETFEYSSVIKESMKRFEGIFEKKKIEVVQNIDESVYITGIKNQIEKLSDILIENASKYVPEGGKVSISLKKNGKKAELKLFNTAVIDDDFDGKKIFDRFYRTDKSRSSSTGGQGIGLSIAKRIVEQHKGNISASAYEDGILFKVII
ncbi:MAG: HAMP domain-containing histidine kinase [Lachnospiraceae bacterium]|nr:HAMP domain-containing histidine kinase [Lachnospiraceae bacterium]